MNKHCKKCGKDKDSSLFVRKTKSKDGFSGICKECKSKEGREYYANNREKIIVRSKLYFDSNRDMINEKKRSVINSNPDKYRMRSKEWRENNKDKVAEYAKLDLEKNIDRIKAYRKKYYINNRDKLISKTREYAENNKHKIYLAGVDYRKKNKDLIKIRKEKYYSDNKADILKKTKIYSEENREKLNAIAVLRRKESPQRAIASSCRIRINKALKRQSIKKTRSFIELTGCSIDELKEHLESLFTKGMNWDNYGLHGWHVDHRKPCASYDLTDEKQQKECFHYSNLQPLWAIDNLKKGSKIL